MFFFFFLESFQAFGTNIEKYDEPIHSINTDPTCKVNVGLIWTLNIRRTLCTTMTWYDILIWFILPIIETLTKHWHIMQNDKSDRCAKLGWDTASDQQPVSDQHTVLDTQWCTVWDVWFQSEFCTSHKQGYTFIIALLFVHLLFIMYYWNEWIHEGNST